jgi:elongation factor 1-beta
MGEVLCTLKVMPTGVDVDIESVEKKIKELLSPEETKIVPVAFGIKAIEVRKIIPDGEGGTDELEEKIKALEGVENVETTGVTLI